MSELRTGIELGHTRKPSLSEVAVVFLKLGTISFGGPAAAIAMMENEFVRKRRWITEADFLDRLGAANLIPGPSSTEVAIFIGHSKCGWAGLLVAGCCFIIPAAVMVAMIAAVYVRFGSLPQVAGILYAIKPAVIAIILQALWSLARTATKTKLLAAIGVISIVLNAIGMAPLIVLAIAGIASGTAWSLKRRVGVALSATPLSGCCCFAVGSNRCRCDCSGQHASAIPVILENGIGRVRKRIRVARVPQSRIHRPSALAYRKATDRRRGGWAIHSRPGLHDCYFYWLRGCRNTRCGHRDFGHLSAGIPTCCC